MITFLRRIRQQLLAESKLNKYLMYAVGEIILVVIGILIALGINNWNQERLGDQRELSLLRNLKEELHSNIKMLQELDSVFNLRTQECDEALKLLKPPMDLKEFLKINDLVTTRWAVFRVNRNTYDEMLNSGSFYSLNNKALQEDIRTHYTIANNYAQSFREINENGQDIAHNNEEAYVIELLEDWSTEDTQSIKTIDTSWINDPNSLNFQAFYKKAKYYANTNRVKNSMIERFIEDCRALSQKIEDELEHPTQ